MAGALETFLTILYYAFMIVSDLWQGPLGKAFREWYSKLNNMPEEQRALIISDFIVNKHVST
jgi:uncharacterized protein YukE